MPNFIAKIGFLSGPFYGLVLLIYLLTLKESIPGKNEINTAQVKHYFIPATLIIFAFGLIVTVLRLSLHLY